MGFSLTSNCAIRNWASPMGCLHPNTQKIIPVPKTYILIFNVPHAFLVLLKRKGRPKTINKITMTIAPRITGLDTARRKIKAKAMIMAILTPKAGIHCFVWLFAVRDPVYNTKGAQKN